LFFVFKFDVEAANKVCNDESLKVEARNVAVTYELVKPTHPEDIRQDIYYYDLTILNINEKMYFEVENFNHYYDEEKDGEIFLEKAVVNGGRRIGIKVYGSNKSKCNGYQLHTVYVQIPYYNKYSEREECKDYQTYNICKINSNTNGIDEEKFLSLLDEIKAKEAEKKNEKPIPKEEKKVIEKIIEWYVENKVISIPATILIIFTVVTLIIIVIKKNKNKIKIDLGD